MVNTPNSKLLNSSYRTFSLLFKISFSEIIQWVRRDERWETEEMTHPKLTLVFKHWKTRLSIYQSDVFSCHLMNWTLSLTILQLATSSSPVLSQFQQFNAISYLIHTKGHDILGNASLLKEMRAFHNVSNQGSWLKFNAVALNIEHREETISKSMLSRPEAGSSLSTLQKDSSASVICWFSNLIYVMWTRNSSPSNLHPNMKTVDMIAGGRNP